MDKVKVFLSCDDNPFYYGFWNDVSYVWNKLFNFDPILIYVSDENNKLLSNKHGEIIRINKIDNFPVYLQAQLARVYYTSLFKNDVCILSDIDMIPINKNFFDKQNILEKTKNSSIFHLNPVSREFGQLPMCYYCGTGETFSFATNYNSWKDFLIEVVNCNFSTDKLGYTLPEHLKTNKLWFSDELFLYTKLINNKTKIIKNNKIIKPHERLDREQLINFDCKLLKNYIDCHMPRPFHLYEKQILYLINNLEND